MSEEGDVQAGDSSLLGSKQKHIALYGCFLRSKIPCLWKSGHPYARMADFGPCLSTVNSYMVKIFQNLEKNLTLLPCDIDIPMLSEILTLGWCVALEKPSINFSFLLFYFLIFQF